MTEATRDLLKRALELPPSERAVLVRELSASLGEVEVDPELTATLERRIRELDEGGVRAVPFPDVLDEAQARIDARRKSS